MDENRLVFLVHKVCCLLAIVLLVTRLPVLEAPLTPAPDQKVDSSIAATLINHRGVLSRLGVAASLIGGLRTSRTVVLPTAALLIGIPDSQVALIIGFANGNDSTLFFASGWIMDRFGRLWAAIPSMVGLGLGHLVLNFVTNENGIIAVALFLALANGLGSGILNTLGSDVAPKRDPAPFLGAWRLTGDAGQAAAPLLVSGITAVAGLSAAGVTIGALGLVGAAMLTRYVKRYVPRIR